LAGRFGMSNREIAEILKLDNGTVRTRLSRARAMLKEIIKRNEGDRDA